MNATVSGAGVAGAGRAIWLEVLQWGALAWLAWYGSAVIQRIWFHPLSKYPGPLLAKITPLYNFYNVYTTTQHLTYTRLHAKYGPIFRDSPTSVSISAPAAVRKIYGFGTSAHSKPDTAPTLGLDMRDPPVFYSRSEAAHTLARRRIAAAYTMTSVLAAEALVNDVLGQWLTALSSLSATGEEVDFTRWTAFVSGDIVSELLWGRRFGFTAARGDVHGLLEAVPAGETMFAFVQTYQPLRQLLDSRLGLALLSPKPTDTTGFGKLHAVSAAVAESRLRAHAAGEAGSGRRDILEALSSSRNKDGSFIAKGTLVGEVQATLTAGWSTIALSLAAVVHNLLNTPSALTKLVAELDAAADMDWPTPRYAQCTALPYLSAVLSETMRLSPAIANIFYRQLDRATEVLPGEVLPAGTVIGINAWIYGRDKSLYGEDAGVFRPERWLEDPERAKRFAEAEFAFGQGSRQCVGRNLAAVELWKVTAALFGNFEVLKVPGKPEMSEKSYMFLYKQDLWVKLRKRENSKVVSG